MTIVQSILRKKGSPVQTIDPASSVTAAANRLRQDQIGALVVVSEGAVVGLISEREIVHAFAQHGKQLLSMSVKDVMRQNVITVAPEDHVTRVMSLMTHHRARHLPVTEGGKLVGIISIGDAVKDRLDDLELETRVLRDAYIAAR